MTSSIVSRTFFSMRKNLRVSTIFGIRSGSSTAAIVLPTSTCAHRRSSHITFRASFLAFLPDANDGHRLLRSHGAFGLCPHLRTYASKNIKREKKGHKTVEVATDEMEHVVSFKEYEASLSNLVEEFRDVLTKQFSLRTNAASLESVKVDLGTETHPLPEIAQISFKNAQTIMINLAATPTYLKPVIKALQDSGLNLNPQTDGNMIYIPVPKVSREHRETLSKNAKGALEKYKERVRGVQNASLNTVKSKPEKSADLVRKVTQLLMDKAQACNKELEEALQAKQHELTNPER